MINVGNHYWVIGGSATEVYQSSTNTMVPADDAGYAAWLRANVPSSIIDNAELKNALYANGSSLPEWLLAAQPTFIQPAPDAYSTGQLASYSASSRYALATGGMFVSSLNATVPFLTDVVSRNTVNSAWDYMNAKGPTQNIQWKMSDGSFITLSTAQMNTLMNNMASFVQSCFTCESNTLNSITAGTVTTLAQIDAAYAAISNVYP